MGDWTEIRLIWSVLLVGLFVGVLYVRQYKNRIFSVVLFVLCLGFSTYKPAGSENTLLPPDSISGRALYKFYSTEIQDKSEVFWNPYMFSGMPTYGSLMNNNLGVDKVFQIVPFLFWMSLGYWCLRFNPSKIEQKVTGWIKSNTDGIPNAVSLLVLCWSGVFIIRLMFVYLIMARI